MTNCNNKYVFSRGNRKSEEICFHKYALLALVLMFMNYVTLNYLCTLGINLVLAKIITESILFLFSFLVQKKYVFVHTQRHAFNASPKTK